jgi:putative transcriptional regulator
VIIPRDAGHADYSLDELAVPSPDDEYLSAERHQKVGSGLKVLPADQAEVIRLSFFEEKPHSKISGQLGILLGTVKSRALGDEAFAHDPGGHPMTIRHHPSDESVLAFANGPLLKALSLVVSAHVDGCALCGKTVKMTETMGGVFLESASPTALNEGALSQVIARLDMPASPPKPAAFPQPQNAIQLPPSLRQYRVGSRRWLALGIWTRPILKDRVQGTRVYLLGAAAGKALPRHGHHGVEMTQVLEGEFFNDDVRFGRGIFWKPMAATNIARS